MCLHVELFCRGESMGDDFEFSSSRYSPSTPIVPEEAAGRIFHTDGRPRASVQEVQRQWLEREMWEDMDSSEDVEPRSPEPQQSGRSNDDGGMPAGIFHAAESAMMSIGKALAQPASSPGVPERVRQSQQPAGGPKSEAVSSFRRISEGSEHMAANREATTLGGLTLTGSLSVALPVNWAERQTGMGHRHSMDPRSIAESDDGVRHRVRNCEHQLEQCERMGRAQMAHIERVVDRFERLTKMQGSAIDTQNDEVSKNTGLVEGNVAKLRQIEYAFAVQTEALLNISRRVERLKEGDFTDHDDASTGASKASKGNVASATGALDSMMDVMNTSHGGGGVRNTESIHLWAVARCVDKDQDAFWAYVAAFASLALIVAQIFVLVQVGHESAFNGCSAHTDCQEGEFCLVGQPWNDEFIRPRCTDCYRIMSTRAAPPPIFKNTSECWADLTPGFTDSDFFGCTAVLEAGNVDIWDDVNHVKFVINEQRVRENCPLYVCTARFHCEETDHEPFKCDHLENNLARMDSNSKALLAILSLFLAVPLANDMDQAAIEEALLNYGQQDVWTGGLKPSMIFAGELVRIGLRIRREVLPVLTASIGVAVLLGGSLTAQELLLNVLAVSFITEADDMISSLCLTPPVRAQADQLVKGLRRSGQPVNIPWISLRSRALFCSVILTLGVLCMPTLMGLFGNEQHAYDGNGVWLPDIWRLPCSDVVEVITQGLWFACAGFWIFAFGIIFAINDRFLIGKHWLTVVQHTLSEVSRNVVALGTTAAIAIIELGIEQHVLRHWTAAIAAISVWGASLLVWICLMAHRFAAGARQYREMRAIQSRDATREQAEMQRVERERVKELENSRRGSTTVEHGPKSPKNGKA